MATEKTIALCEAARDGNLEKISELLKENSALISIPHPQGKVLPIDLAARKGQLGAVKLLVQKGGDLTTYEFIYFALSSKNQPLLDYLSDKEVFKETGITPLHIAAATGRTAYFNEMRDTTEIYASSDSIAAAFILNESLGISSAAVTASS